MSPTMGVFIMMNNYFHDVATALLLASGVVLWIILKKFGNNIDTAVAKYFISLYESITKLARFSVTWIIVGGIPRTIFYTRFEWSNAAGKGQVPALIVKHILMFVFVVVGAWLWVKLSRRVREIKGTLA